MELDADPAAICLFRLGKSLFLSSPQFPNL